MKNDFLKSIIVLGSICLIVAVLLSSVNMLTAPLIKKAELEAADKAFYDVLPDATEFENIEGEFPDTVIEMRADKGKSGYAFKLITSSSYSQSPMQLIVGIGKDGKITKISFVNYAETKGSAKEFEALFEGKDSAISDIVAGATYTTAAIKSAINDAYTVLALDGLLEQSDEQKLATLYDKLMPAAKDPKGVYNLEVAELPAGADAIFTGALVAKNRVGYLITATASDKSIVIAINAFGKAYAVYDLDGNDLTTDSSLKDTITRAEGLFEPIYKTDEKRNTRSLGTLFSGGAKIESISASLGGSTVTAAFKVTDNGKESFAIIAQPYGYGGSIKVCYILDKNGIISKFKVMSHNESAYYGDKIGTSEYASKYEGSGSDTLSEVDLGVSGATITSKAMQTAFNDIFAAFSSIKEGF